MYDKSVAGEHRAYNITVTSVPTSVYDLIAGADKVEFDNILNVGLVVETSYNHEIRVRVPVDGYVLATNDAIYASTSVSGALEPIPNNSQYVCPVYFWTHKTFLSTATTTQALVRIFFS